MSSVSDSDSKEKVMGTRDLVENPNFTVEVKDVTVETEEERAKAIREKAEARVRNALTMPEGEELSPSQKDLALQYEKVIRNEPLTPLSRSPGPTNGRFQIDTAGRVPIVREKP
jgi:hypothetical protein